MALIVLALAISAIYSGTVSQVENDTFHLGLCFILSVGFLGLLLK